MIPQRWTPLSKEAARRWLPALAQELRAELADVCAKWAVTLIDDVARPHEALYRAEAARLRWRIDRIWEAQQRLAALPYDRLPGDFAAAFSADAADAWWTARQANLSDLKCNACGGCNAPPF